MGYERSDRRFGRDPGDGYRPEGGARDYERGYSRGEDRDHGYGREENREGRGQYGRRPTGYEYDDRGFFDRAGDEVRSWFGDEEAERRRRWDERMAQRDYDRSYGRGGYAPTMGGYSGSYDVNPDYGAGRGAGATSNWGLGAGRDRATWGQETGYHSWRNRQIEALDRDYDEYRREHQSRFDKEFGGWRTKRTTQRESLNQVQEQQEVVGSDGAHVGIVDHVRGDRILLTKGDRDAGGHHHSIPSSWINRIAEKVEISKTADEAHAHWRDEERNSGLFGSERGGAESEGPHILNRSFSGTY